MHTISEKDYHEVLQDLRTLRQANRDLLESVTKIQEKFKDVKEAYEKKIFDLEEKLARLN